ncbi:MAG: TetR/AcrR family transcriptional regulator [Candidatus Deferrimicrobium sp.]
MKIKPGPSISSARGKRDTRQPPAALPNKRASKVLKVAGELFLSRGYAGVSLETIVARTGGSFRDLYQAFGSKESLFLRVMTDVCEEVLSPLRELALDQASEQMPLEEVLSAMGRSILRVLLSTRVLCLHRLVVSGSPPFPALGKLFFQAGPGKVNETVAAFLRARAERDGLVLPEPLAAAAIFINSLAGDLQLRAITGGKVSDSEVEARLQEAVRVFLSGVRRPDRNAAP